MGWVHWLPTCGSGTVGQRARWKSGCNGSVIPCTHHHAGTVGGPRGGGDKKKGELSEMGDAHKAGGMTITLRAHLCIDHMLGWARKADTLGLSQLSRGKGGTRL